MSFLLNKGCGVKITVSDKETDAVKIAAVNLKTDLNKVLDTYMGTDTEIVIGTFGVFEDFKNYVDIDRLKDKDGTLHKETYVIAEKNSKLFLGGTDRRGTIYAIYTFCESIGVSPWYFFADVPVKKKDRIEIPDNFIETDYPTVEYRGIFINDEEELERWVQLNMGEETIGVKTYEKIFELLLRLRANYIWPAMHVNSFNIKPENGALAHRMGIVVGTSHCDMLMRSNNREWLPWLDKKGYKDVEYDYSIEGRNREILKEYWGESIDQNKEFEVSYTLGMRGIHDSGFEVRELAKYSGDELTKKKIELLELIIHDQEEMLDEKVGKDTLKTFVPYKEVLNLYDAGLKVPEDLTLIWSNDNYGNIRRYPSVADRKRSGGNGIYYHNSYWSPPNASYLFICSIPIAKTKNELKKAFDNGIQKLWVLNVGAIKPIEPDLEFFVRYAWEITKETTTNDVDEYIKQWINKNFSNNIGKDCAEIFNEFDALTDVRKVEFLENDVFSINSYGDEWTDRINTYRDLYTRANALYYALPDNEKPAFYELVLMKIHAGYYMNAQYYYADRSTHCHNLGMLKAAEKYTQMSLEFDNKKRELIEYYNHIMLDGKWHGILLPETFPPPVAAMHPICTPPVEVPKDSELIVSVYNNDASLTFCDMSDKWIDMGISGSEPVDYKITYPDWLLISESVGTVKYETRILVSPKSLENNIGEIVIYSNGVSKTVPVRVVADTCSYDEEIISLDIKETEGWKIIKRLGRGYGDALEAQAQGGEVSYTFSVSCDNKACLEIDRSPSLNSVGRIRVGVSIDNGEYITVESESNDEHKGNWQYNILNNVDRLFLDLGKLTKGNHTLTLKSIDKYFAFSQLTIYLGDRKYVNIPKLYTGKKQALPKPLNDNFYNINKTLPPRPQVFAMGKLPENTLLKATVDKYDTGYGNKIKKTDLVNKGKGIFKEENGFVKIDVASALANTEFANATNEFLHCNSTSCANSSLALYTKADNTDYSKNPKTAPCLSYMIDVLGGEYSLWVLTKESRMPQSFVTFSVDDGKIYEKSELYNRGRLWRYETEQIWHWTQVKDISLSKGKHKLSIYSLTSGTRFDRICLTKPNELPPTDLNW